VTRPHIHDYVTRDMIARGMEALGFDAQRGIEAATTAHVAVLVEDPKRLDLETLRDVAHLATIGAAVLCWASEAFAHDLLHGSHDTTPEG
jgi:hypothetical protein